MDTLSRLLGNEARVKCIRFLILNDKKSYSFSELEKQTHLSSRTIKKETEHLKKCGLVKIKKTIVEIKIKGSDKNRKVKTSIVSLDNNFGQKVALKNFFIATSELPQSVILKRLNQTGKIKLIVTAGLFMENLESRLDLFIVGDRLNKEALDRAVRSFEAILGRELRYAYLETQDFTYRVSIYDRLVRDVLDRPHQKLLNKIGL